MNRLILAASIVTMCVIVATAHDTWLLPSRFSVPRGTKVAFDLTSGMGFPTLDTAIKPERIDRAMCRLGGRAVALDGWTTAPKALHGATDFDAEGVAAVWCDLKPRSLELTPKQVAEYLDEIGAPAEVRNTWKMTQHPRRWRESYVKHAKTFVRVGAPDGSWAEPVGMALEIVPEKDPTSLRPGDAFPVRVLEYGAPLADFAVGIVRAGQHHGRIARTDAAGRVVFTLDRAGKWMLRGTRLRPATQPDLDWESDFTTLTLEVVPK